MLKISKTLELPLEAATQTFAILARKRVGKTYTASVIAEEMCEARIPFVVLDPTGAWYGLRSSKDGKSAGLPVIIIGGAHGDIPLEFSAGKTIAEFVVENPGFYVLDLSGSESDAEQDRFATAFAQRLYRLKDKHRDPLHLFVDEADSFAPQRPFPGQAAMLGAFEAIVRRGGIRGIGITLITQRAAVLNKNVLTQAEILIALQTTGPQDQKAVEDWVKMNATPEQHKAFMGSIASLGQGEAWVWSPAWLSLFDRVKIRERNTFNSSATPKVGEKRIEPAKLADVDLEALRTAMAETIEKAKADDPKELKKTIASLSREVESAKKNAEPVTVEVEVERQVEVFPIGALSELADIHTALFNAEETIKRALEQVVEVSTKVIAMGNEYKAGPVTSASSVSGLPLSRAIPHPSNDRKKYAMASGGIVNRPPVRVGETMPVEMRSPNSPHFPPRSPNGESYRDFLVPKQQKMLDTLLTFERLGRDSVDRGIIGAFAGMKSSGGSFNTYISAMKNGREDQFPPLIEQVSTGVFRLTEAGRASASCEVTFSSVTDLHEAWKEQIKTPKQRDIVDLIVEHHPDPVPRSAIAEHIEMSPDGGSFNTYLSGLKSLGIIAYFTYEGERCVSATDLLFPEGL